MQKWMLRTNDYDGHRLFRWYNEHENARIRETYEIFVMPFWTPEPIRSAEWSVHHEGEQRGFATAQEVFDFLAHCEAWQ